jgi:hypothetical protein
MKSTVKNKSKHTEITIADKLDDQAISILSDIHNKIKNNFLVFDLKALSGVNSYGTAARIKFISSYKNYNIEFRDVSPDFIRMCNMLSSAKGGGRIFSYMVPYHCDACNLTSYATFELAKINGETGFPNLKCSKCKELIESEEAAEEYLSGI